MKECKICTKIYDFSRFYINRANSDGLDKNCRECERARRRNNYLKHKDREIAYAKKWNEKNPGLARKMSENWRKNNLPRRAATQREWARKNKHKVKISADKTTKKKKEADLALFKGTVAFKQSIQCAKKRNILPKWITKAHLNEIKAIYIKAARISQETNTPHDVDHIIPIHGKIVTGLHVPWNLQILTHKENAAKSNKLILKSN